MNNHLYIVYTEWSLNDRFWNENNFHKHVLLLFIIFNHNGSIGGYRVVDIFSVYQKWTGYDFFEPLSVSVTIL